VAAFGDENIGRLDVTMDDTLDVGSVERVCNLYRQAQQNIGVDGPSTDAMLQRQPVQKLHGDERCAVLVINLVDGADVRMIQCGSSLRFSLEAG